MISIKSKKEIEIMRHGGKILAAVLKKMSVACCIGVKTIDIDNLAYDYIKSQGATPSFKNFNGYKYNSCISLNNELVHGIPSNISLKDGDVVGLDAGVYYQGYHTDSAITIVVGKSNKEKDHLINTTRYILDKAISLSRPGVEFIKIQEVMQDIAQKSGYGVVRDLCGHGIGKILHEDPVIPNFVMKNYNFKLEVGMTLAYEPMITEGDWHVNILDDDWTVSTADGKLACHFEHTIAITEKGAIILTK